MKTSFKGFNEKVLTFECDTEITAGTPAKLSDSGKVAAASAGDRFIGIVLDCRGGFATVQVGGFVTVGYTGTTAPTVNYAKLVADGAGKVKVDATNGGEKLVICVDTTDKTVGFIM